MRSRREANPAVRPNPGAPAPSGRYRPPTSAQNRQIGALGSGIVMATAPRVGRLLVLVGALVAAVGFLVDFVAAYGITAATTRELFGGNVTQFLRWEDAFGFCFGPGFLIAAVGWSLEAGSSDSVGLSTAAARPALRRVGIAMVLGAATLVAVSSVYLALVEELSLSVGNSQLPFWFPALASLFTGIGIVVAAVGWTVHLSA